MATSPRPVSGLMGPPPATAQPSCGSPTGCRVAGVLAAELGSVAAMISSVSVAPSPSLSTWSASTRASASSREPSPERPRARIASANGVTKVSTPVFPYW